MKRICCALLMLALSAVLLTGIAEEWGPEQEIIAEMQHVAETVATMGEAYALIPEDSLWTDGWLSYAQEYGFEPIRLTPDAAYDALRAAYDADQGVESYAELFQTWGLGEAKGAYYLPIYCWPTRRTICEAVPTARGEISIEVVAFDGSGDWQEDGALIFMKPWGREWQLIDYMPYEAEGVLLCGDESLRGVLIQFLCYGHGTGYYAEQIALYNPLTRRCEGGYTRIGHDVPRDYGMYVVSQVYTDSMRVIVVSSTAFATGEWSGEGYGYTYTQRAQDTHAYVYSFDEQDGSFTLTVDAGVENASPAILMNIARNGYDGWELVVP